MDPVDVTAELGRDNKPENRVYRTSTGHLVKIKTTEIPAPQMGQRHFRMTGSICDASGAALRLEDGSPFLVAERGVGVTMLRRGEGPTLAEQLDEQRLAYAIVLQRVALLHESDLPAGVAPAPPPPEPQPDLETGEPTVLAETPIDPAA